MISFQCRCGRTINVPDSAAGRRGKCPKCGAVVTVPAPAPAPAAPYASPYAAPASAAAPPTFFRPAASQPANRGVGGLGIAALVLGIVTAVVCWVPWVGALSIPLAVIGLILGGAGVTLSLVGRRPGMGVSIAGGVACVVSIVITLVITTIIASAARSAQAKAEAQRNAVRPQPPGWPFPPPPPPPPTPTAPPGIIPSTQPAVVGSVEVRITEARVTKVALRAFGGEAESSKPALVVTLRVTNRDDARKAYYRTWGVAAFALDFATAKDEIGNTYKAVSFETGMVVGRTEQATIYPGKDVGDVLIFQPPDEKASSVLLTLPARHVGGQGDIHFSIPRAAIQVTPTTEGSLSPQAEQ